MSEHVRATTDSGFESDVLQAEQPVLVDFWAEWCAPCKAMNPAIEAVAEKYAGSARIMKMNIDDNPSIAQRYGIRGLPTLILFKGGREEDRIVGSIGKEAISRLLDKHIDAARV
jgi:thioredoxin 1